MSVRKTIDAFLRRLEKNYDTHNRIEVSESALLHNFDLFERLTGQKVIPVLKGNAYGHGLELVAKILKQGQPPYIAVDGYFEALRIREVSSQPVLIMGAIASQNYTRIKYNNFTFVVDNQASIRALGTTGRLIKIHLEFNTGMNRYGADPADAAALTKLILRYRNLQLEGVMSHLADSDGDDPETVQKAVKKFDQCVEAVRAAGAKPTMFHVAQSAGSVKAKSKYANAIRLGLSLYGINPFLPSQTLHQKLSDLRPVMKLVSTITKVIQLKQGDKVSYNYTFTAPKNMTIGVLPLGYHEGVNRSLSNKGVVKIEEKFNPIVGRVCMNHTMISLEGTNAKVGDEVVVYSNDATDPNSINNISYKHNLFAYTLPMLSPDVRRIIVK